MDHSIHGHEVLDFMAASGTTYTRASLAAAIAERFGPGARFHTCAAEGMTAMDLIAFLVARGKFRGTEAGFTVATEHVCDH